MSGRLNSLCLYTSEEGNKNEVSNLVLLCRHRISSSTIHSAFVDEHCMTGWAHLEQLTLLNEDMMVQNEFDLPRGIKQLQIGERIFNFK